MRMYNEEKNFVLLDNIKKRFDITIHMQLSDIINMPDNIMQKLSTFNNQKVQW